MPPARRLSPAERALWARVAADVRALDPSRVIETVEEPGSTAALRQSGADMGAGIAPAKTPSKKPCHRLPRPAVRPANTLDASWDRRLATGAVAPDVTIDLHGCSLNEAHQRLDREIADSLARGARLILLITGRPPRPDRSRLDHPLRGIIRASVLDWIAAGPNAARIAAIRAAHPRHGGAGALYVVLRRARN